MLTSQSYHKTLMPANIVIYGKGRVGNAVASLAKFLNIPHRIIDDTDADFSLKSNEILIPSPGVPPTNRAFLKPERMLAELDFAAAFLPKNTKLIGITGTDGKSTTTWMIYEMLRKEYGDNRVFVSGNFEVALSATVEEILQKEIKNPIIVVEISSFMAYGI